MTTLEIVVITAVLLVNAYLAISELRVDFSQRLQMKRLIAKAYARLRAARCGRRYGRRFYRKEPLGEPARGTMRNARTSSTQKSRVDRDVLRHRPEGDPWRKSAATGDDAGQQDDEKKSRW